MQFGPAAIRAPAPHVPWPWAVTAIDAQWQLQRSDAQAAALQTAPMTFDYQNTTMWCAPTWSEGRQAISEAQALAAEHGPVHYHIGASKAKVPVAQVQKVPRTVAPAAAAAVAASAGKSGTMRSVRVACIVCLSVGAVEAGIAVLLVLAWCKIRSSRGSGSAGQLHESRVSSDLERSQGGQGAHSQLPASSQWVELVSQAAASPPGNANANANDFVGQFEVMDTLQVCTVDCRCAHLPCCFFVKQIAPHLCHSKWMNERS